MAEAAFVEADQGSSHSPLVSVSFQKNEQRKFKFLEGEPKALGITQICMSIFHISCIASLLAVGQIRGSLEIPVIVSSVLIFIAGALAIAAKNLHLPTLRACLGMEIVAAIASLLNLIITLIQMNDWHYAYFCYHHFYNEPTNEDLKHCRSAERAHAHLFAELVVVQVALFAISVTLVVYAGKVGNCCAPSPKVPVITIQAPPAPQ